MKTQNFCAYCTTPHEEIWKDISGYEGLYQISNFGRVKSLARMVNNNGGFYLSKERFLKAGIDSNGYALVVLSKNDKNKSVRIHRLVAIAFVNNLKNTNIVNHIDGNKLNNIYTNLEWITSSQNNTHAYKTGLKRPCKTTGRISKLRKLTYEQALKIKNLYKTKKYTRNQIAQLMNISKYLVNDVLSNKCYKEVA